MSFVILDLEWDSAYSKKHKRFINQILQIGAVKLDENLNEIDKFEITVRSEISKKVTNRFANLTGITTEKMLEGVPFNTAVERYNTWVGNNTVTMTWSDSDLYSIKENEENLLTGGLSFKIEEYLDLQKFVQNEMRLTGYENKNQISLSDAAENFGITTEGLDLHTALDDSILCAKILKKCYNKERFSALIRNTQNPEFYRRMLFRPYPISNIRDENIDKKYLEFTCDKCSAKTKQISKWRYQNRWFSAKFQCSDCKRIFVGRVTFKKTYDSVISRQRICELKPKTENKADDMQPMPEKV